MNSLYQVVRRFRLLRPGGVALLLFAIPVVLTVDLSLRFLGVGRTMKWISRVVPLRATDGAAPPESVAPLPEGPVWALDKAARLVAGRSQCLRRSIAVWAWLRIRGVESQVSLGVRRDPRKGLTGHAWVSRGGEPLFEGDVHEQHLCVWVRPAIE